MPTIPLHLPPPHSTVPSPANPLPHLLHTPSGLAILEIQGTLNLPPPASNTSKSSTPIGRLVFPDYSPHTPQSDTAWMKRVHLYVGLHQRLTGEVKKLPQAVALVRKREGQGDGEGIGEELEIVEIVYWKVMFSARPEPVGS